MLEMFDRGFGIQRMEFYIPPERYTLEELLRLDCQEFSLESMRQIWTETAFEPENLYEFLLHQTYGPKQNFALPRLEDAEAFAQRSGINHIHCASNESSSDMAVRIGNQILSSYPAALEEIDLLIYYHSAINEQPSWSTPCRLQHELGIKKALAFSISQKSGNGVLAAIKVAHDMMNAESGIKTALLIGSEKVIPPSPRAFGNMTLIGDSATALILNESCERLQLIDLELRDFPHWWNPFKYSQDQIERFEEFLSFEAVQLIATVMERQQLRWDDVKLLLAPNFSLSLNRKIGEAGSIPRRKIYAENISRYGYLLTSDMVVNIASATNEGQVRDNDIVVFLCMGLGLSLGAGVLRV